MKAFQKIHLEIIFPLLILFFMFFNAFFNFIVSKRPPIEPNKISIIEIDSLKYFPKDIIDHNATIISTLNNWIATDINQTATEESIKMQNRFFYVAILAALITFLFRRNDDSKQKVKLLIFFLIILTYSMEVHLKDLERRRAAVVNVKVNAVDSLINLNNTNLYLYKLNLEPLKKAWEKASSENNVIERWERKFYTFLKPDSQEIIIYFLPFSWILYEILRERKKISTKGKTNAS